MCQTRDKRLWLDGKEKIRSWEQKNEPVWDQHDELHQGGATEYLGGGKRAQTGGSRVWDFP